MMDPGAERISERFPALTPNAAMFGQTANLPLTKSVLMSHGMSTQLPGRLPQSHVTEPGQAETPQTAQSTTSTVQPSSNISAASEFPLYHNSFVVQQPSHMPHPQAPGFGYMQPQAWPGQAHYQGAATQMYGAHEGITYFAPHSVPMQLPSGYHTVPGQLPSMSHPQFYLHPNGHPYQAMVNPSMQRHSNAVPVSAHIPQATAPWASSSVVHSHATQPPGYTMVSTNVPTHTTASPPQHLQSMPSGVSSPTPTSTAVAIPRHMGVSPQMGAAHPTQAVSHTYRPMHPSGMVLGAGPAGHPYMTSIPGAHIPGGVPVGMTLNYGMSAVHSGEPAFSGDGRGKRRRLTTEERLQRSRERNRLHARKTRQRKKVQMQIMQSRADTLLAEQRRLLQMLKDRKTADILLGMSQPSGSGEGEGSTDGPQSDSGTAAGPSTSTLVGSSCSGGSASSGSSNGSSNSSSMGHTTGAASYMDESDSGSDSDDENDMGTSTDGTHPGTQGSSELNHSSNSTFRSDRNHSTADNIREHREQSEPSIDYALLAKDRNDCSPAELEQIRRERNRMHAKRTRDRKKLYLEETEVTISRLEKENRRLCDEINDINAGPAGSKLPKQEPMESEGADATPPNLQSLAIDPKYHTAPSHHLGVPPHTRREKSAKRPRQDMTFDTSSESGDSSVEPASSSSNSQGSRGDSVSRGSDNDSSDCKPSSKDGHCSDNSLRNNASIRSDDGSSADEDQTLLDMDDGTAQGSPLRRTPSPPNVGPGVLHSLQIPSTHNLPLDLSRHLNPISSTGARLPPCPNPLASPAGQPYTSLVAGLPSTCYSPPSHGGVKDKMAKRGQALHVAQSALRQPILAAGLAPSTAGQQIRAV